MKTNTFLALLLALVISVSAPTTAFARSYTGFTIPELSEAQSAMVIDAEGNVLYSLNPEAEFNMASITKVMTAVVALESGMSLDTTITCQGCTLDENAQRAGYVAGQTSTFADMLKVTLVFSANDGAEEIAVAVAGSEAAFVDMMNAKAQELGMTHTHFENPHGLDAEGHHSCVSDLVTLARYALTKHPYIAQCVSSWEATVPWGEDTLTFSTTDAFLKNFPGAIGIKTGLGNTTACFLGAARQNGLTLYSCVLGCTTSEGRFNDTSTLMSSAFSEFSNKLFASPWVATYSLPFAYHFGLSCQLTAPVDTYGYVALQDEAVDRSFASADLQSFGELNTVTNVAQWTQGERVVATTALNTGQVLVKSRSGFGLSGALTGFNTL